jgi:tRNA-dihydrouridine synthase B
MLAETGCAGVMAGRAAEGNPWLFAQIAALLAGDDLPPPPDAAEKLAFMLRHLDLLIAHKGEATALKEMRRHALAYTKGLPRAAEFRSLFGAAGDIETFAALSGQYVDKLRRLS